MTKLVPPVSYQGGKQRLAKQILTCLATSPNTGYFHDLCCGSGAVALEAINQGWRPDRVVMVDHGPWGLVWQAIGEGRFDLDVFAKHLREIPADQTQVKGHCERLAMTPVIAETAPYVFLILQATTFGGKAIWIEGDTWRGPGFRGYWMPTATSSRRYPVNSMMPMPETILARMQTLVAVGRGLRGLHADVTNLDFRETGIGYLDPPYQGLTGYGGAGEGFDVVALARSCPFPVWVSEAKPLNAEAICLTAARTKGSVQGGAPGITEWLSPFGQTKNVRPAC